MKPKAPSLTLSQGYLSYQNTVLFENLELKLKATQCTVLLGPSGVGKTSLLRMIAKLHCPESRVSAKIETNNGIPAEAQLAYMAQTDCLYPWKKIIDNVLLGFQLRGEKKSHHLAKAKNLLKTVGLGDVENYYPHQLSGGMRQRAALVRTLLEDQALILMDEPFSNLDAISRFQLQNLAADLLKNKTRLLITHDPHEALRLADEIYILSGRPAQLRFVMKLNSESPRDLRDPEIISAYADLYHELSQSHVSEVS